MDKTGIRIIKRGRTCLVEHPSGAWIGCDSQDSAAVLVKLWTEHDEMIEAIRNLVDDGAYDDEGDYVLVHENELGDKDYSDHKAIREARLLLARIKA